MEQYKVIYNTESNEVLDIIPITETVEQLPATLEEEQQSYFIYEGELPDLTPPEGYTADGYKVIEVVSDSNPLLRTTTELSLVGNFIPVKGWYPVANAELLDNVRCTGIDYSNNSINNNVDNSMLLKVTGLSCEMWIKGDRTEESNILYLMFDDSEKNKLRLSTIQNKIRWQTWVNGGWINNFNLIDIRSGKYNHYIFVYDITGKILSYVNGRLVRTDVIPEANVNLFKKAFSYARIYKHTIFSSIRFDNYALSASEVAERYNGGRVDEYVLPKGYKYVGLSDSFNYDFAESINDFSTTYTENTAIWEDGLLKVVSTSDILRIIRWGGGDGSHRPFLKEAVRNNQGVIISVTLSGLNKEVDGFIGFEDAKGSKNIKLKDGVNNITLQPTDVASLVDKSDSNNYFNINIRIEAGTTVSFSSIKGWKLSCIAEFLPHNFTKSVAYDSSGQSNHLQGTGITDDMFLFEKPYKERLIGSAAPTVVPDVIGQKFYDQTNKKIYEAVNTTSAEDWV